MRFLKNKILNAQAARKAKEAKLLASVKSVKLETPSPLDDQLSTMTQETLQISRHSSIDQPQKQPKKSKKQRPEGVHTKQADRPSKSTKNVVINFGKAISSFATSKLGLPYIEDSLKQEGITYYEFADYVCKFKNTIGGIESFKSILQCSEEDAPKVRAFKRLFKMLSEVFIKYFSVNWITHGKILDKMVYLRFRGKMLRRVQDPESFTYIKKRANKYEIVM